MVPSGHGPFHTKRSPNNCDFMIFFVCMVCYSVSVYSPGKEQQAACQKAPKTCELIRPFKAAATNKVGQVRQYLFKYSSIFAQLISSKYFYSISTELD